MALSFKNYINQLMEFFMYIKNLIVPLASAALILTANSHAGNGSHLIGWQTFDRIYIENCGNFCNDKGVTDTTPDNNSTFDATPAGGISESGHYLSGVLGVGASNEGFIGKGVVNNSSFLNNDRFGTGNNGEFIMRWPLAGTSPKLVEVPALSGKRTDPFLNTVILTLEEHSFLVGDTITVSGFNNANPNGTKTVSAVTGGNGASGTVSYLVTTGANGLPVGTELSKKASGIFVSNFADLLNRNDPGYDAQRWPLVGESPKYIKVSASAGSSSTSTVTLAVDDHSFSVGDQVLVTGFNNDHPNGVETVSAVTGGNGTPGTVSYFVTTGNLANGALSGSNMVVSRISGIRIGPFLNGNAQYSTGAQGWKFSNSGYNNGEGNWVFDEDRLNGDVKITNHSDYHFKLMHIHYSARGLTATGAAKTLELKYLASPGNLIKKNGGGETPGPAEVADFKNLKSDVWTNIGVKSVSIPLSADFGGAVYIPPGESAAFRFQWSGQDNTLSKQTQIDNLAFEGTFYETGALLQEIDPAAVPAAEENVPMLPLIFQLLFAMGLAGVSIRVYLTKGIV